MKMKSPEKWLKIFISVALIFISLLPIIKGLTKNYAVYIYALEALAYHELNTTKTFVNGPMTTRLHPAIKDIKKHLHDFTWNNGLVVKGGVNWTEPWMKSQAEKMADNPIAAYSLISRTNKYWPLIFNHSGQVPVGYGSGKECVGNVTIDHFDWPNEDDLEEAMDGIIISAHTYEANISEMAVGKIGGISTGFKLTSGQCADLSWYANKNNYSALAVEWLEQAIVLKKMDNPKKSTEKLEKKLQRYIIRHDEDMELYNLESASHFFEQSAAYYEMCQDPTNINSLITSCPPRKRASFECAVPNTPSSLQKHAGATNCYFSTICSGRNYQTVEQKSRLFCWYESTHPYLRIGPTKMEFLSISPDIVQIYNVIGDKMINKLMNHVKGKFRRATTRGININQTRNNTEKEAVRSAYLSMGRYAMTGWGLDKIKRVGLTQIPKTVEILTGLDVMKPNSSEPIQVASYSFSGYYVGHHDGMGNGTFPKEPGMGDRLATFMYYLSDVEMGGGTAFLAGGVAARPVKGSAVLWYNIYGNSTNDYRMMHAACPVVLGRKFVGNEWVHITNQFRHRPCLLNPNEPFRILVNGKMPP